MLENEAIPFVEKPAMNAGQIFIAPDYVLVQQNNYDILIQYIQYYVQEYYGDSPKTSDNYARIISQKQYEHLKQLYDDVMQKGTDNILDEDLIKDEKFR